MRGYYYRDSSDDGYHLEDTEDFETPFDAGSFGEIKSDEAVELNSHSRNFIKALLDGEVTAIAHVANFYSIDEDEILPTSVTHTIWTGQEAGGFHHYTVKHGMSTVCVDVTLDSPEDFNFKVIDVDTVSIVSPEPLFGVDVTVETTW